MATITQIEANRLNAQKSTGPTSPEGKAKTRFNALKHGADAQSRIIPGEDAAERLDLARDYYDQFQPEGPHETDLLESIVDTSWEMRRVPVLEAALIATLVAKCESAPNALGAAILEDASGPNALLKLFRRKQAARRDWLKLLAELRRVQDERLDPKPAVQPAGPSPKPAPEPEPVHAPAPAPIASKPAQAPEPAASKPAPAAQPAAPQINITQKNPKPAPVWPIPEPPAAQPAAPQINITQKNPKPAPVWPIPEPTGWKL